MRMARYRLILKLSKKSGYRQCVAQFLLRIAFLPPPAVILSSNINLLEGRTMKRSIWCRNRFASPSNPAFFWCCVIAAALAAALFTQPAHAQQIAIEKTGFDSLPSKFFYFKNSEVYKVALLGIPGIWLNLMGFFSGCVMAWRQCSYLVEIGRPWQKLESSSWYSKGSGRLLVWTSFRQRQGTNVKHA